MDERSKKLSQISDTLVSLFEHYYSQAYQKGFRLNKTANEALLENFFERLEKRGYNLFSIGEDWLDNYLLFQFDYWADKETERSPTINWFIGGKAFLRFESVADWNTKRFWVKANTADLSAKQSSTDQTDFEDIERKRYHNEEGGLQHCLTRTSLYVKSFACLTCKVKESCKLLLKENYPQLYRKRLKND